MTKEPRTKNQQKYHDNELSKYDGYDIPSKEPLNIKQILEDFKLFLKQNGVDETDKDYPEAFAKWEAFLTKKLREAMEEIIKETMCVDKFHGEWVCNKNDIETKITNFFKE